MCPWGTSWCLVLLFFLVLFEIAVFQSELELSRSVGLSRPRSIACLLWLVTVEVNVCVAIDSERAG